MIFKLRKGKEILEFDSEEIISALHRHGMRKINYCSIGILSEGRTYCIKWRNKSGGTFSLYSEGTYINIDGNEGNIYWGREPFKSLLESKKSWNSFQEKSE